MAAALKQRFSNASSDSSEADVDSIHSVEPVKVPVVENVVVENSHYEVPDEYEEHSQLSVYCMRQNLESLLVCPRLLNYEELAPSSKGKN